MNTVIYSTGRPGWNWGVIAGCLVLHKVAMEGGAPTPARGPSSTILAGRIIDHWALTYEAMGTLSFQAVVKVLVMPDRYIMVSAQLLV